MFSVKLGSSFLSILGHFKFVDFEATSIYGIDDFTDVCVCVGFDHRESAGSVS